MKQQFSHQASLPRLESLSVPGMLFASTIRSPFHKAKNAAIHTPSLPKGYSFLSNRDLEREGISTAFEGYIPYFAGARISYRGEALGLVIGPDPAMCDELARGCAISADEEEPSVDWDGAPRDRVVYEFETSYGDPEVILAAAENAETASYRSGMYDHNYSEPMGALASWEYDKLVIHCASQWPSHVRTSVAQALGVQESDIVVEPTELGKALDGRLWFPSLLACQAAIAAKLKGSPVKILYTREENYRFAPKQAGSLIRIASATDPQGRLSALDIEIVYNIGAYNPLAAELLRQAASAATGIYGCPAMRVRAFAVSTNMVPLGAMGSVGTSNAYFAIEAHMNHLAQGLRKTPAEIKTLNMLGKGESILGGPALESDIPFARIHKKLEEISDYRRKYASYELVRKRDPGCREGIVRGIALTVGYQTSQSFSDHPFMNTYAVEVTLDRDSNLNIGGTLIEAAPQTLKHIWADIASSTLSLGEDKVHFGGNARGAAIPQGPLSFSRGVFTLGRLVERSCRSISRRRFRESLPITVKSKAGTSRGAASAYPASGALPLLSQASWCGTAVEIEIDPLSGDPKPLAVWMVVDAGRIISPSEAASSLRASVISSLNLCLQKSFDPLAGGNTGFLNSRGLDLARMPEIHVDFIDPDRNAAPRGIGELAFLTIPAAFYSALTQAVGIEPRQLPISGIEILNLLEKP